MAGLCQRERHEVAAAGSCSRATALPEVQGGEVSWGKQTWVLPAAGGEPGHGCRRAAVTKPCQAPWSPGDSVTQRHTSGSLSFTRVLWQGVGPATNHGAPPQLPGWEHTPLQAIYVQKSLPGILCPCLELLGGSGTGMALPSGATKRRGWSCPNQRTPPQLKTDLAGASRQKKLCLSWPGDIERAKLLLVIERKTGLTLHQF